MHRFFLPQKNIHDDFALLEGQEAKHAFTVLRLKKNDRILFFDEQANFYSGIVQTAGPKNGRIRIEKKVSAPEKKIKIILAAALPKSAQFDEIVDETTQLGVDVIIPLVTERTIAGVKKEKYPQKTERWRKIAVSAAKQSQNPWLPEIRPVSALTEALAYTRESEQSFMFCLDKDTVYLKDLIRKTRPPRSVSIFIGPEGDFTAKEISLAKASGCRLAGLGDNVLRCKTAAAAVLSIINYEWKY